MLIVVEFFLLVVMVQYLLHVQNSTKVQFSLRVFSTRLKARHREGAAQVALTVSMLFVLVVYIIMKVMWQVRLQA